MKAARFPAAATPVISRLQPWLARDAAAARRRVEGLERLLEGAFAIPGTNRRVGLDALLGFVPVAGDLVAGAMGLYLVWEARNLGMSKLGLVRMTANVGIDTMLGAIPLVGDVFDFFYRSNSRNLRLVRRHLDRHAPAVDARR